MPIQELDEIIARAKGKKRGPVKESAIVDKIMQAFKAMPGCVAFKHHGTAFGVVGHSDIYGVYKPVNWPIKRPGIPFYIEVKRPGEHPRQNQLDFLANMQAHQCGTGVAHDVDEAKQILMLAADYYRWE